MNKSKDENVTYSELAVLEFENDDNDDNDNNNDKSININNNSIQDSKPSLLGIEVLIGSHSDIYLLMATKALRLFAFEFLAVMLVLYLSEMGFIFINYDVLTFTNIKK